MTTERKLTAAEEIAALAQRILQLAPEAGLYIGIKIDPATPAAARRAEDGR